MSTNLTQPRGKYTSSSCQIPYKNKLGKQRILIWNLCKNVLSKSRTGNSVRQLCKVFGVYGLKSCLRRKNGGSHGSMEQRTETEPMSLTKEWRTTSNRPTSPCLVESSASTLSAASTKKSDWYSKVWLTSQIVKFSPLISSQGAATCGIHSVMCLKWSFRYKSISSTSAGNKRSLGSPLTTKQ